MAEFWVKSSQMKQYANDLERYTQKLYQYSEEIERISNSLSFNIGSNQSVARGLRKVSYDISEEAKANRNMANGLKEIARRYKATEEGICAHAVIGWGNAASSGSTSNPDSGSGSESKSTAERIDDIIYKMLTSAAGPIGAGVDIIRNGIEGNAGNVISNLISQAGGVIKNIDGGKIDWGELFDAGKYKGNPLKNALGKYVDFSSVKNGISTACNWAAALIESGYDNFKEFGEFTGRFWGETVTETLIKAAEGIAVGAGIGAIVTALGVSAPVWAVGAVTAGVTVAVDWALDSLVEWATKGSQTSLVEAASDFVCDTGEKVGEFISDTGEKVGEFISDTGEKVGKFLNDTGEKVGDAVSKGFNKIKKGIQNIKGAKCGWGFLKFG